MKARPQWPQPPTLVNNAPAFDAETASISVDENAEAMAAVGDPIVATDANEEELTYAISGDDAASFEIWPSGQITVAPDTAIDYETKTSYSVTVTATDTLGASDIRRSDHSRQRPRSPQRLRQQ